MEEVHSVGGSAVREGFVQQKQQKGVGNHHVFDETVHAAEPSVHPEEDGFREAWSFGES